MSARAWQRMFLGNAAEVVMDGAGRILITPELRAAAALDRNVMLLGMGSHFEIWDADALKAKEQEAISAGIPPALSDFSL